MLRYHNLPLRRFAATALMGCCTGVCFTSACYKRPSPLRAAVGAVVDAASHDHGHDAPPAVAAGGDEAPPSPSSAEEACRRLDFRRQAFDFDWATRLAAARGDGALAARTPWERQPGRSLVAEARRAAAANVSAVLVSGKYRDEVELAVQHATALRLPGAAYRLERGVPAAGACVLRSRATPAQLRRPPPHGAGRRAAAANCSMVVVAAAEAHADGFRAVMLSLGLQGFRKQPRRRRLRGAATVLDTSAYIAWVTV